MMALAAIVPSVGAGFVLALWLPIVPAPAPVRAPAAPTAPVAPDFRAVAAKAGGTVGFAALELSSGRSYELRADEEFPTQSVFKLPVAIAVLSQIDSGRLDLDQTVALGASDARGGPEGTIQVPANRTVRALLEAMIINSDNVACDKLLALAGGPAAVDAFVRGLGIRGISIRVSEREMASGQGDNTATPRAMIALLAKIARRQTELSPTSARFLDDILLRVATGQKRLKAGLPQGTPIAHKTGTSRTAGGITDATNDVGLITLPNGRRIAIVVFVHASPANEATREGTIAALARIVCDTFSSSPESEWEETCYIRDPAPTHSPFATNNSDEAHGTLDKEVIRRVVRQHIAEVRMCYDASSVHQPRLAARVVVYFEISGDGEVRRSRIQSTTVDLPELVDCMGTAACGWHFPKPLGGGKVMVSYPFVLYPSDGKSPRIDPETPKVPGPIAEGLRFERLDPSLVMYVSTDARGRSVNGLVAFMPDGMLLIDVPLTADQSVKLLSWGQKAFDQIWMGALLTHDDLTRDRALVQVMRRGIPIRALDATVSRLAARGIEGPTPLLESPAGVWDQGAYEVFHPNLENALDPLVVYFPRQSVLYGGALIGSSESRAPLTSGDATALRDGAIQVMRRYPHPTRVVPGMGSVTAGFPARTGPGNVGN